MKELETIAPEIIPERTEIKNEKEHHKALRLIGKLYPHPGHIIWEFNMDNSVVQPAEFENELMLEDQKAIVKKLITKTNCVYKTALNINNAAKHFASLLPRSQHFHYIYNEKRYVYDKATKCSKPYSNQG